MRFYRAGRGVVIVTAALIPVLATVTTVPRWVLGLFGAIAVIAEGLQGLFQFQRAALNAMKTSNDLERTLNRYMTAIDPYQGPPNVAFPLFVRDAETIREAADDAFLKIWQATVSAQPIPQGPRRIPSTDPTEIGRT
jgi:hypothetical protein